MRRIASWGASVLATALVLAMGAGPAGAQTATPEEKAAAIVRPSIVYIEMDWSAYVRVPRGSGLFFVGYVNGGRAFHWRTRCSGFVVNPSGYIVTAGHCVDDGELGARDTALRFAVQWLIDNGWAFQRDFRFWLNEGHLTWGVEGQERGSPPDLNVYVQRGVAAGGLKTGEAFPARVVDYQDIMDGDVALLKIEETDLPSVTLAPSEEIQIGTDVLSVGYPGSSDDVTDATYEPTFKDGQINSKKTREGGLLPVYEMSAALSGGMSGGPTVNLTGEVIGVNSFSIFGETEAFNFITPSSLVLEMLSQNGVSNELGPIDEAYRAGLGAYFAGDYRTAVKRFDEVLALSPTHQQAQEFRVEASKKAAAQPDGTTSGDDDGGGLPTWAFGAIGAGALVLVLLVVLATRRRRPAPVGTPTAPVGPAVAAPIPQPVGNGGQPATTNGATSPAPATVLVQAPPTLRGTPRFCANCGQGLEQGTRFCASCGHQIP
ncbi:MAG: trypsin-like peptidase domain-containing protein [Actinomycetota bacterium]